MSEQIHIRDAETVARIRRIARARGVSLKAVVAEAVRRMDSVEAGADPFDRLLELDRARVAAQAQGLDELYDPVSGLPR